jgi:hypothetical protein
LRFRCGSASGRANGFSPQVANAGCSPQFFEQNCLYEFRHTLSAYWPVPTGRPNVCQGRTACCDKSGSKVFGSTIGSVLWADSSPDRSHSPPHLRIYLAGLSALRGLGVTRSTREHRTFYVKLIGGKVNAGRHSVPVVSLGVYSMRNAVVTFRDSSASVSKRGTEGAFGSHYIRQGEAS